jgi:hypothetical protein
LRQGAVIWTYAAPHLASGRLHALSAAICLPEGYYLVTKNGEKPRVDMIERLEARLVAQARSDDGSVPDASVGFGFISDPAQAEVNTRVSLK